ncbi:MAG: permease-like cell division protein FtsX [Gammaproteobacteria bacterium]
MKRRAKHQIKQEGAQTKLPGGNFMDRLRAHRDLHAHSLFSSLGRLVDKPFGSMLTVGVLAIAIALAAGFYLIVVNLQQLAGNIEYSNQISLYLKDNVSETAAKALAGRIKKIQDVQAVKLIGKDQALKEFQTYGGFGSAINALQTNPLPIVLEVLPGISAEKPEDFDELMQLFMKMAEVDLVQMDRQWMDRLHAIIEVAWKGMLLVRVLLGSAVLFVTGNTIRLELHNRRDEVVIAKLVGATNAFIKRPFLYSGLWIGFFSGVLAWFIVTVMMLVLWQAVDDLSRLYGGSFHLLFLNYSETMALLAISSGLSVLGSWVVLTFQLRELKPV